MEYSLEKNVSISSSRMSASDSVSLPRLDDPAGACPAHRRQWADFLAALTVLPHRQYKTARTETRCHLLLKIWQMTIQTSASRGYVLLREYRQVRHKSPTNCLPGCGHDPRSAPNLERHGSSWMQTSGWLEMPHFLNRISICISIWNPTVCPSRNITCYPNEICAYRGNSFLSAKKNTRKRAPSWKHRQKRV